jgi:hypothetical protein
MSATAGQGISESVRLLRTQLRELNRKRPLEPFRIHLNDGRAFDVRHPNMLIVLDAIASIGIPESGQPNAFAERTVHVDLTDVRAIENFSSATRAQP